MRTENIEMVMEFVCDLCEILGTGVLVICWPWPCFYLGVFLWVFPDALLLQPVEDLLQSF